MIKLYTGIKATLTINGLPIVYVNDVGYGNVPIEVQHLCLVLARLGVREARRYIPLGVV